MKTFTARFLVDAGFKYLIQKASGKAFASFFAKLFLSGPLGVLFGFGIELVLANWLEDGIITLDIAINKIRRHVKPEELKQFLDKARDKAQAKVYTEEEKNVIRQEYMDALKSFAAGGMRRKG